MQFLSKIVLKKFIKPEVSSIGFDDTYIEHAVKKHTFVSIKIFDLTSPQASILKQTALSVGCDCAVNKGVIDCSVKFSNCILSGTVLQIENIAKKLSFQPFSLSKLADNLLEQLYILNKTPKTKIMGILNLTQDSFSDGGEFFALDKAINHAIDMIESGAHIIDIGAQSTRPGAELVDIIFEIEKVVPVIQALKTAFSHIELSIDTFNLSCAKEAIDAGVDIINDVSFLSNIEMAKLCGEYGKKLVITHSKGDSKTMDSLAEYENIIDDIYNGLNTKIELATKFIDKKDLIIDVGFGFAKNFGQNFTLLKRINEFKSLGCEMLAGVSRKRFLQDVINTKEPKDSDIQTLLASGWLIQNNIDILRVHNVELTNQAVKFYSRMNDFS